MTIDLSPVKLASLTRETPRALRIRLEGGPLSLYEGYRLPGMYLWLQAAGVGPAPVAIASQPERKYFEALVDLDDPLGRAVGALAPGAEVEVSAPRGAGFPVFDFRRHDVYLVGYGLGLGLVRAAVLHALTERGALDRLRVLAEARFVDEIPFRDELPAWQRAGVTIYQVLARPDMAKWKRGEGAYAFDLLRELRPDPARTVVLASGPDDVLQGIQGVAREIKLPPEKLFLYELLTADRQRAAEAARPPELAGKITAEGTYGSGHQKDAPDHAPGFRTPKEQPKGAGLAPYQQPRSGTGTGAGAH